MSDTILDLDGVVGGYGRITILNGCSFQVRRGTLTTIIGPNGAGKSTVFKAIFGLIRPTDPVAEQWRFLTADLLRRNLRITIIEDRERMPGKRASALAGAYQNLVTPGVVE